MKLLISTNDNAVLFTGESIRVTGTGMYVIDDRITIPPSTSFKVVDYTGEIPSDFDIRKYVYSEDTGFVINEKRVRELLQAAKNAKIDEFNTICEETIYKGTDVTLKDGSVLHFTLDDKDQANLSGIAIELITGATTIMWHEDDHSKPCRFFDADDAWTIIKTMTSFKTFHVTYFRDARIYIESLTDENTVRSFSYGDDIPEEYKSDVLKSIGASMLKSGE